MFIPMVEFNLVSGDFVTAERLIQIARILVILVVGIPLIKIATRVTAKLVRNRFSSQSEMLIKRFVYYAGVIIILISVLNEFGFKLSALLGAAGIIGIAIGFAAQTSISNIISGIFLISEKPFMVGDLIQVGETTGNILTIDLLSIKVRTADNKYVRIPNETMLKSEVTNISRFPIRRLNLHLAVTYNSDLDKVLALLQNIAAKEPLALKDPSVFLQIEQFNVSGIHILFGVWSKQEDISELRNALMLTILSEFDRAGISMPFTYATAALQPVTEVTV